MPEGGAAGLAGRRDHLHLGRGDLGDPPGGGAEHEGLARPHLVDHLLVELTDAAAVLEEGDRVEPAVGDGAGVGDRQPLGAAAAAHGPPGAVPDHARPQLGELVGGVGAREHLQGALQRPVAELGEGVGAADEGGEIAHRPLVEGAHGDDLLGEHVEGVAGHPGVLDLPAEHELDDGRALQQVAAVLGEDHPLRRLAHVVARPADALDAGAHPHRRLDLDHQVDRAHVDAELEAGGGDESGKPAALERILDLDALLACDGSVVGAHQLLAGELVEARGQPLGEPSRVDEDDRRAVGPDELEDPRMERGPDAPPRQLPAVADRGRGPGGRLGAALEVGHVFHRHLDADLEPPPAAPPRGTDVDDLHLPSRPAEEARHLLERPLGGREPDPLRLGGGERAEALEAQGEVGAALGGGEGMDLVDDDPADAAQPLARGAGEQEVERLGGGDEDVGGAAGEQAAMSGTARPRRSASRAMPRSGARRLRSTSTVRARSGET